MLELRKISKKYTGILAVDEVSFQICPGVVTGYLGPNGSGKSTTIKMLIGLVPPTSGEVLYNGQPIEQDLIAYRRLIGYVPEEAHLYTHLTGDEYLELVGQLRGIAAPALKTKVDGLLELFSLQQDRHVQMSAYSKGMRQKILIAAALLHNPEILILDEPFTGLDVNAALLLRSVVQSLAAKGKLVLLSSHELDTVERVCSRVIILHKGRVAANGSIDELRALMSLPRLEEIFSQLAVEQDTPAITAAVLDLMER